INKENGTETREWCVGGARTKENRREERSGLNASLRVSLGLLSCVDIDRTIRHDLER
ncbi:hypothetical protein X777_09831, partial [Ooceraea biroi]